MSQLKRNSKCVYKHDLFKSICKTKLAIFLLIPVTQYSLSAQDLIKKEKKTTNYEDQIFIPGYVDTIIADTRHFAIHLSLIANGFKLQLKDTSYKLLSFVFTFDTKSGISEITSKGDQIVPTNDSIVQYSRISEATLVTIERIRVVKNNRALILPSLYYYVYK